MGADEAVMPLYYQDCYLAEAQAQLADFGHDEQGRIFVKAEPTIFHPHGGGQKGDRGFLSFVSQNVKARFGDGAIRVMDTRKGQPGSNLILDGDFPGASFDALARGIEVLLLLDWDFRYMQMRLHGTAHLLHCFVEEVLGRSVEFPRTSDLQETYGLNRYEIPGLLDENQMAEALDQLNLFIQEDHKINIGPDLSPAAWQGARLWRCDKWTIPCGGTHVHTTKELGVVATKLSTKRGRTSITFSVS
jgi:Ser-tRNA(Ala) deacylase AlaX